MKIGVTVSQNRPFPELLRKDSINEYIIIDEGNLKRNLSDCDVLYLWNLAYAELYEAIKTSDKLPRLIHIARQEMDEELNTLSVQKGFEVTNAKGVFTESISEFAVTSIYMLSKNLHLTAVRKKWEKHTQERVKGSKTLILGKGSIGTAVAELLSRNGVTTLLAGKKEMASFKNNIVPFDSKTMNEISSIVCCLPLNDTTYHVLDLKFFSYFSKVNFINISRGAVVNTNDLEVSLNKGFIKAAVLDTFEIEPLPTDSKLWTNENVVVSAHQSYKSSDWAELLHQNFLSKLK